MRIQFGILLTYTYSPRIKGTFVKMPQSTQSGNGQFSGVYSITMDKLAQTETKATLPPFVPIQGQKWFSHISRDQCWDSQWLEKWTNHFCPSMGPNRVCVAMDSGMLLHEVMQTSRQMWAEESLGRGGFFFKKRAKTTWRPELQLPLSAHSFFT